ncbi:hypothetical protein IWQ62_003602 [Dispira parvispora]|uniref:Uncharacterized protein n=1 Tax=Dispira parvispora TaxID=1520584 RepID=A0A9W8E2R8_9FUNG|nr:hypothetical protein IWQ62_003602 [Dispira parvispora]
MNPSPNPGNFSTPLRGNPVNNFQPGMTSPNSSATGFPMAGPTPAMSLPMGNNLAANPSVPAGMANMRPPPGAFNANLLRYQAQLGIPPNAAVPLGAQGNVPQPQVNLMTAHMARPFGNATGHPSTQFYPGQAAPPGMPVQGYPQLQSVMMSPGVQSQPHSMGGNHLTLTGQPFPNSSQGPQLTSPMAMRFSSPPHTPFSPGGAPVSFSSSGSMPSARPVSTPAVSLTPMGNKSMSATVKQSLANRVFHNTFSSNATAGATPMHPTSPINSAHRSHPMSNTPTTSRKKSMKSKLGSTPTVSQQPIDNFSEDSMDTIRPLDLAISRYIYNQDCMNDIFSLVPTNQLKTPTCPWDEMDPQQAKEKYRVIQDDTKAWQGEHKESIDQCRRRIATLKSLNQKIQSAETLTQLDEMKEAVDDLSRQIAQPMGTLKTVKIDTYSLPITSGTFTSL